MTFARRKSDFEGLMPFSRRKTDLLAQAIVVDPDEISGRHIARGLEKCGINAEVFSDAEHTLNKISRDWNGVVILQMELPGTGGLELLSKVKEIDPEVPVILIVEQGDIPSVVKAMRLGAYEVVEVPLLSGVFAKVIHHALEKRKLVLENRGLRSEIQVQEKAGAFIIGKSKPMQSLAETLRRVAGVNADVLLIGETGTGKELAARCLHEQSHRRQGQFVAINCCAIPEDILESELFGHEPGAFTGAQRRRIGKFEYADGGTLYLDEVDSMPLHLQGKILRVLQERSVERLGSNQSIPVDIRIVASTKMDLKKASEEGRFREDLYYRLNVICIPLTPLRERREDIPVLFQYFVLQACARFQRPAPQITNEIVQSLLGRDWPGNVRELKNAAERFTLGYDLDSTRPEYRRPSRGSLMQLNGKKRTLVEQMNAFEKTLIEQELARTSGNVKATYLTLGLPRKTLYDKMKKYSLRRKDFISSIANEPAGKLV